MKDNPAQPSSAVNESGQNAPKDGFRSDLLIRYLDEFVRPLWWQIVWALILTAGLAAVTGGYPIIIKHSFDTILNAKDQGVLHWVLIAVIGITAMRSLLMYLQNVASNRIAFRIGTDMQKRAFAQLMAADFARQTQEAPGQRVSRLTNDVGAVQMATQAGLNTAVRDT
ncbi:MAG: ABC transporter transmembrane domain-containing protein, partial [Pseudomonadota bacterium]